jgi:catechol 2,3-dioxygenase-like lactoylglutathione lyase family enzyme
MRPRASDASQPNEASGINHVTFAVRDLDDRWNFYEGVLGCRFVASWNSGAYLLTGELWITLVADREARNVPLPEYTHVALTVDVESLDEIRDAVRRHPTASPWQPNQTQGTSVYIVDPNGQRLELATSSLEERLMSDRRDPPPGWIEDSSRVAATDQIE